jgi:hypothetical protein
MTEAELQHEIEQLCEELGLLWHHCRDSRTCTGAKGFPDLVIAGIKGALFVELKSEDGETTANQDLWLWHLGQAPPYPARIWKPCHLRSGQIRTELERIAK